MDFSKCKISFKFDYKISLGLNYLRPRGINVILENTRAQAWKHIEFLNVIKVPTTSSQGERRKERKIIINFFDIIFTSVLKKSIFSLFGSSTDFLLFWDPSLRFFRTPTDKKTEEVLFESETHQSIEQLKIENQRKLSSVTSKQSKETFFLRFVETLKFFDNKVKQLTISGIVL